MGTPCRDRGDRTIGGMHHLERVAFQAPIRPGHGVAEESLVQPHVPPQVTVLATANHQFLDLKTWDRSVSRSSMHRCDGK